MMNSSQDMKDCSELYSQEVNLDYESLVTYPLLNKSQENLPTSEVPETSASATTSLQRQKLLAKLRVDGKSAFVFEGKDYACTFCPVRLTCENDLLEHWRWELEKAGIPETLEMAPTFKNATDGEDGKEGVGSEVEQKESESMAVLGEAPELSLKQVEEEAEGELRRGCKRERSYTEHLESDLAQSFACDKCDYSCTKWDTLTAHKNRKHKWAEANLIFSCEYCDYSCNVRDTLNAHIRRRHKGFPIRNKYKRMETLIEDSDPRHDQFSCDQCEYSCNVRDTLNAHKRRKHKNKRNENVEDMKDAKVLQTAVLPPDLKLNPGEENPNQEHWEASDLLKADPGLEFGEAPVTQVEGNYLGLEQCDECDYTCDKHNTMLKHKSRNHSTKKYGESRQGNKVSIRMHKHGEHSERKAEFNETFFCDHCSYTCTMKATMNAHKYRSHNLAENEIFFCDQCDYNCTKKDTLNAHKNRKHKEADMDQTFSCEFCEYSCNRRDTLNAHRNRKHREGDTNVIFSCELCEYSCSVRDTLNAHVRRKHKVKG